jgi:hypothetical protein
LDLGADLVRVPWVESCCHVLGAFRLVQKSATARSQPGETELRPPAVTATSVTAGLDAGVARLPASASQRGRRIKVGGRNLFGNCEIGLKAGRPKNAAQCKKPPFGGLAGVAGPSSRTLPLCVYAVLCRECSACFCACQTLRLISICRPSLTSCASPASVSPAC